MNPRDLRNSLLAGLSAAVATVVWLVPSPGIAAQSSPFVIAMCGRQAELVDKIGSPHRWWREELVSKLRNACSGQDDTCKAQVDLIAGLGPALRRGRFIDEPWIGELLVAGLETEACPDVQARSSRAIQWDVDEVAVVALSDRIVRAWERWPHSVGVSVIAMVDPDHRQLIDINSIPDVPDWMRARLGDNGAGERLVKRLDDATLLKSRIAAATDLGLCGTFQCGIALAHGIFDRRLSRTWEGVVSWRLPIVDALGRIHKKHQFLNQFYLDIESQGDDRFGQRGLREAVVAIEEFAIATYSIDRPSRTLPFRVIESVDAPEAWVGVVGKTKASVSIWGSKTPEEIMFRSMPMLLHR